MVLHLRSDLQVAASGGSIGHVYFSEPNPRTAWSTTPPLAGMQEVHRIGVVMAAAMEDASKKFINSAT
jgi:hypothetical protein